MGKSTRPPHVDTTPSTTDAKFGSNVPRHGFIVAAALSDGDVIGVHRDGGTLELRWVDAMSHDQAPITLFPEDLSRIEYLMYSARTLLESEGE